MSSPSAPNGRCATAGATSTRRSDPASDFQPLRARALLREAGWADAVLPAYSGGAIDSVGATVLLALGCDASEVEPPIAPAILDPGPLADSRVVVLVVLDGYGSIVADHAQRLAAVAPGALVASSRLTSVFPSTTAAALTSLQTGVPPARHGVAGYTLYIPEARKVVNMVQFAAVDGTSLPARAVDPATFLPVPTIYALLEQCGIESLVVSHREYARSPLTILHSGDTPYRGHRTVAEFAALLLQEARRPGRRFIFGYWAGIDMLAHTYGPESPEVALEVAVVEQAIVQGVLQPLARGGDDVTLLLTADHGLVTIPEERAETITTLARSTGKVTRPPTGERRVVGLMTKDAEQRAHLSEHVGERGVVLETVDAIAAGLFGPQPVHDSLLARIGNTLLLARDGYSFPYRPTRDGVRHSLGAHGSLTPEEMYVPLLVWRFGNPGT